MSGSSSNHNDNNNHHNNKDTRGEGVSPDMDDVHRMRPSYVEIANYPVPQFDTGICKSLDPQFIMEEGRGDYRDDEDEGDDEEVLPPAAEPIQTFLRIRPYFKRSDDETDFLVVKDDQTVIANTILPGMKGGIKIPKRTEYKFSKVLDGQCSQQYVFDHVVAPLMEHFDRGENCLVFSYGASNSGKTFTMQGTTHKYGVIPRTLDYVFNRYQYRVYQKADIQPFMHESTRALTHDEQMILMDKKLDLINFASKTSEVRNRLSSTVSEMSSHCGSIQYVAGEPINETLDGGPVTRSKPSVYSLWVSFVELYNEKCYDLLGATVVKGKGKRPVVKVVSDKSGNAYMKDLIEIPVFSEEEAFGIYIAGTKRLQMGSTMVNQSSSRSHCFFSIRVVELGRSKGNVYPVRMHRITFCDLAGMERVSQTENTGHQLRESANINQSLLSLLKVIRMIREKQATTGAAGQSFLEKIPFRDSQLTRIFRGYFTSSTHIVMIVNVNPNPVMIESSTMTLQNSAIASNIIAYRQSAAAKIVVEDFYGNNSFLHSSRDIEDIEEEEENEQPSDSQTVKPPSVSKKSKRNKFAVKSQPKATKVVKSTGKHKNNGSEKSKSNRKGTRSAKKPAISDMSDSEKENVDTAEDSRYEKWMDEREGMIDRVINLERLLDSCKIERDSNGVRCRMLEAHIQEIDAHEALLMIETKALREQNEQYRVVHKDLDTENDNLRERVKLLEKNYKLLAGQNAKLRKSLDDQVTGEKELKEHLSVIEEKNSARKQKISEKNQLIRDLKAEVLEKTSLITELELQLIQKDGLIINLEEKLKSDGSIRKKDVVCSKTATENSQQKQNNSGDTQSAETELNVLNHEDDEVETNV